MGVSSSAVSITGCGLPDGDCEKLQTLQDTLLSINIVCVSLTLILLVILQMYKSFPQRIFCNLLATNLLSSFTHVGYDGSVAGGQCSAQAFFLQTFDMCTFMWIGGLTVFLFLKLIKSKDSERYEWLYVAICWLVPVVFALLPFITKDYGPAAMPYCWIIKSRTGTTWRYLAYWGPVVIGVIIILVLFVYMIWDANRAIGLYSGDEFETMHRVLVRDYLKPLTAYAAAFVLITLVQLGNRIHQIYHEPSFGLIALHIVVFSVFGIVLCTLFIIFTGYKRFSFNKVTDALKLCCIKQGSDKGDVTTFNPEIMDGSSPGSTLQRSHATRQPNAASTIDEVQLEDCPAPGQPSSQANGASNDLSSKGFSNQMVEVQLEECSISTLPGSQANDPRSELPPVDPSARVEIQLEEGRY